MKRFIIPIYLLIGAVLCSCKPSGEVEIEEEMTAVPKWSNLCEEEELVAVYTLQDVKVVLERTRFALYKIEVDHFRIIDSLVNRAEKIKYKDPQISFLYLTPVPNNLPAEFNLPDMGKELIVSGIQYLTRTALEKTIEEHINPPQPHGDGPPRMGCFKITSIRAVGEE